MYQLGVSLPDPTAHVKCMVITELCEKGDLFDYIVRAFSIHRQCDLTYSAYSGVSVLHHLPKS